MRTKYLEGKNVVDCCGCRSCEQACPVEAISMQFDAEGFLYPDVDLDMCIDCGVCAKVCGIDNANKAKHPQGNFFAAFNNNVQTRKISSSGGVFSAIAEYVLDRGGVVYGAAFTEDLQLEYTRVENKEGLDRLRGSKYIQADTENSFSQVKRDLEVGRLVYFVGTGCQIAGLKLYLRKDYNNLLTSDLVCHGTPSIKLFHLFTDKIETDREIKLKDYKFRDKTVNGWSCSSSSSYKNRFGREKTILYDKTMNAYMNAFLSGAIAREVCYECPFVGGERTGDVTLADYWSIRKHHPEIDYQHGVSCISVNTESGNKLIKALKANISTRESRYEWAVDENYNLKGKTIRPKERDAIYKNAFSNPERFINQYTKKNDAMLRIKFELKRLVRRNERLYFLLRTIKKKIC